MKRLFVLLFSLLLLGSCTIEEDYYRDYREPPARVRVETPYGYVYRHYREVPLPRSHYHHHDERSVVTVPVAPRHGHPYATHGHDSEYYEELTYNNNNQVGAPVHGHD